MSSGDPKEIYKRKLLDKLGWSQAQKKENQLVTTTNKKGDQLKINILKQVFKLYLSSMIQKNDGLNFSYLKKLGEKNSISVDDIKDCI